MGEVLRLRVNGADYSGWKRARVVRGIESVAGGFDLEVSDRWAGRAEPWPIVEEDECSLLLGDDQVITGHVERRTLSMSSDDHALVVFGRDRAGLLIDCSAVLDRWEFHQVPLLTLATKLCEPFGIRVTLQAGLTLPAPLAKVSIDPGDTAFEALERACRMAAVLPVSDGQGGLVLTRAGSARCSTALVLGENVKRASLDSDASGRFARYLVLGQHQGTDELAGAAAAAVRGEARDENVTRPSRVLLVRAEGAVTGEYAKRRAQWEAAVRAGRAEVLSVTVAGWRQGSGALWPVNALVPVRIRPLGIDGDLLISQATHYLDESEGSVTELTLRRPDAYRPEPVVTKAATSTWKELS